MGPWSWLLVAGGLEVAWAIGLKYTQGFSRPGWSVFTVVTMLFSFYCLSLALKQLPLGTSYAIWTGIGVIGTAIAGMILFNESTHYFRLISILLIILGIAGLRLTQP